MARQRTSRRNQRSAGKPDVELGEKIRAKRLERKLTQTDLACEIGVTFQQVQKYETGANRVTISRMRKITDALNVPATFFFEDDKKHGKVESLLFTSNSSDLRLMRAYASIRDKATRHSMVVLVENIATKQK